MSLIRRSTVSLSLKHMSQMPSTVRTHNLRPLHSESSIRVSRNGALYGIKVRGPATARLEFMVGLITYSVSMSVLRRGKWKGWRTLYNGASHPAQV